MTSTVYKTGTVSVTSASATVTGTGTGWAIALVTGGVFSSAGVAVPILSVENDTSLTLAYPWPGSSAAGQVYAISRETSEAVRAAWTADRLATIITKLAISCVPIDGGGTIAERDALDPVPANGFRFLTEDPTDPELRYYKKVPSGWEGPYVITGEAGEDSTVPGPAGEGFTPAGAWDIATAYDAGDFVSFNERTFVSLADGNTGNEPPDADEDDSFWMFVPTAVGPEGPQGDQGVQGNPGAAATITVGTVTTIAAGEPATVTNVGTSSAAVFDFEIPQGEDGEDGDGAGDMVAATYDPNGFEADVFDRANHTGTQLAATISDFSTAADARVSAAIGVTVQAYNANLTLWAAVTPSSYLTTAAAALAYQPLDSDLTSWAGVTRASGFDTFAATPSSANLRTLLTDETGTGVVYFVGGALGTPASATLTNATGLPAAGVTGTAATLTVENQALSGGATVTSKSLGTLTTGTLTLDTGDRPLQHYTNGGAHTLTPGSVNGATMVDITNNASAGAITTSGFTKVAGDSFTTTNAHKFRCHVSVGNGGSLLIVQALQ